MHLALIESQRRSTAGGLAEESPDAQTVRWRAAQANAKEHIKFDKLQRLQMFVWFWIGGESLSGNLSNWQRVGK